TAPDLRGHARRRAAGAELAERMNKMAKLGLLALAWIGCTAAAQAAAPKTGQHADYDRLVDAVVARYRLPGIAVGVIEHGKVTYMRGVGELADTGRPIDSDTLFKIASTSKAMTATVLARLGQQRKLRWDSVSESLGRPVSASSPTPRM